MMPQADLPHRSPLLLALFRLYLRWLFWRKFQAIRLSRGSVLQRHTGRPLVIFSNHPSWWDPALMLLALPRLFPGRPGFGPMDAAALQRYGLFRNMGVFGIELKTLRGAATFLRVAAACLREPTTMLYVTAEGAFTDPRARPIHLRPGLAHLARRHPDAVFIPLALDYTFWNEAKPEALLRFGAPVLPPQDGSVAGWQAHLGRALEETMDALVIESAAREPAAFTRLLSGKAGVGGIYDVWRRARATLGGAPFDARHQPEPPA